MRRRFRGRKSITVIGLLAIELTLAALPSLSAEPATIQGALKAKISTSSYGVPHILADNLAGAGFGLGYSEAKSNICEVATRWLTVSAQRSRYFDPDEAVPTSEIRGATATNL